MTDKIKEPQSDADKIAQAIENHETGTSHTIACVSATTQGVLCLIAFLALVIAVEFGAIGYFIVDRLSQGIEVAERIDQKAKALTLKRGK